MGKRTVLAWLKVRTGTKSVMYYLQELYIMLKEKNPEVKIDFPIDSSIQFYY